MEDIIKASEQLDNELMSQFVIESMGVFDYVPKQPYSDNSDFAYYQKEFQHYCLQAKCNLIIDKIKPSLDTIAVTLIKNQICEYLNIASNRNNHAMKWLYNSNEDEIIIQQVKMLTKALIYKEYENIANANRQKSLATDEVSTTISILIYFIILTNPYYTAKDFNRLFIETWFDYYENWMATEFMFNMAGPNWREQFRGVLLFEDY